MDKQTDMKIVKAILFILVLYGTVVLIVQFGFKLKTRNDEYKSYLGKEYVLDKDTLTIINYNQYKYLFVLSNGITTEFENDDRWLSTIPVDYIIESYELTKMFNHNINNVSTRKIKKIEPIKTQPSPDKLPEVFCFLNTNNHPQQDLIRDRFNSPHDNGELEMNLSHYYGRDENGMINYFTNPQAFGDNVEVITQDDFLRMTEPDITPVMVLKEQVNHPQHYGGEENPYEAIKVIENWDLGFNLGNTVKYISRSGKKSSKVLEDLEKAKWYLEREIINLKTK